MVSGFPLMAQSSRLTLRMAALSLSVSVLALGAARTAMAQEAQMAIVPAAHGADGGNLHFPRTR